ncbi:hypothetical protein GPECTOR_6g855 [Gonium pectorale]|uniref:HSBP1 protein n=1 Tax=Gonium pectorale TaxID=33097 RepID=A0A150GVM3_GONPE|nr:hypothetical protein GPECTOR_6g855 [Gonium pectorale]|eukprot:KXZ53937.1 hypothetical protein GPECTOR_6g855 [Gonium pectorale]
MADNQKTEDVSQFVNGMLTQMQSRFQLMSANIVQKIDDMGQKIDSLETTITELLEQAGNGEQSGGAATKERS